MKKKIVIKFSSCCDKCRSKAMKIAVVADGVMSVTLEGDDKDKLVVIGERVDAACLTNKLRKRLNCAELVSVEEVKPPEVKKPEVKKPEEKKPTAPEPCCQQRPHCELVQVMYDPNPTTCIVM